ncbi:hypothetical protein DPMN_077123 [Dreissena polymorpha]|uniref:Uncharacterized protein n=1 Tax=Dreissena polymorpha TaxID=45954 RepID=A0A9D4BPB4_DREPO|nr:hypothetical protein DPMN_077123 [Dreissena polymorpha]
MCVQRRFIFFPRSLGHKSSVNILAQYAATAHFPHRYPFIHLGGEEQLCDKFIAQENSGGLCGIQTRDLSISKPASYL